MLQGAIIGALLSVLFYLAFVERQRRPSLDFQVEESEHWHGDRKFLRVLVVNRNMDGWLSHFVDREPALMCRAFLTFLHESNEPMFRMGRRMFGRWPNTPEPAYVVPVPDGRGNVTTLVMRDPARTRDYIDIPPNSFEPLDVVMRVRDQDPCMGWHNAIIQNSSPEQDEVFQLPRGRFNVLIRVRTGGRDFRHVFRIVNDVPIEDFRLELLAHQPPLAADL